MARHRVPASEHFRKSGNRLPVRKCDHAERLERIQLPSKLNALQRRRSTVCEGGAHAASVSLAGAPSRSLASASSRRASISAPGAWASCAYGVLGARVHSSAVSDFLAPIAASNRSVVVVSLKNKLSTC